MVLDPFQVHIFGGLGQNPQERLVAIHTITVTRATQPQPFLAHERSDNRTKGGVSDCQGEPLKQQLGVARAWFECLPAIAADGMALKFTSPVSVIAPVMHASPFRARYRPPNLRQCNCLGAVNPAYTLELCATKERPISTGAKQTE